MGILIVSHGPPSVASLRYLPDIIGTMGQDAFGPHVMRLLADVLDAEHCSMFQITKDSPYLIVAVSRDGTDTALRSCTNYVSGCFWRHDSAMSRAMASVPSKQFTIDRFDPRSIADTEFREKIYEHAHIRERILLCGVAAEQEIAISILRTEAQPVFSDAQLHELGSIAESLIALVARHNSLIACPSDLSLALTSLREIEATLLSSKIELPKREAEVCARILYGVSTAGIALDLGIGEETVATYRKRAYTRLAIATQRELLVWYVREWSKVRALAERSAGAPSWPSIHEPQGQA
jgi:DNA-binding CsgD family transcriptional regulator